MMPAELDRKISEVDRRIRAAERAAGRPAGSVSLLAVSKTKPFELIRQAHRLGLSTFGENYAQELAEKAQALADLDLSWHFIGPIQSNKTSLIAECSDWVHSIDRLKIARRLSEQRPPDRGPLNILIQVKTSNEERKSGVAPEALPDLVAAVSELPNLALRGLMTIPAPATDEVTQAALPTASRTAGDLPLKHLDTLSMGMSQDLEAAISEGATIVRVGTDIFGARYNSLPPDRTAPTHVAPDRFSWRGNMATAMITGLIAQGFSPAQLRACDPSEDALARLEAAGLTQLSTSPERLFTDVDLTVLAVKPQVVPDALSSVGHQLSAGAALLSIAAGIPVSSLRRLVAKDVAVIRCMPNTPAMVGLGASALYAGDDVNEDHRALAEQVTNAAGTTVWVASENLLDAVTAVSGSGPAYFFALIEAVARAGTELGLDEKVAMSLTLQTAMGARRWRNNLMMVLRN